jgi:HK97 family phage portal protein
MYNQQRAGVPVTVHTALQVDSVFTSLRVLSNAVIKLGDARAFVEKYDKDNHPYRSYLPSQPPILTSTWGPGVFQYDGTARSIMSLGLFGEAFWYTLERDRLQFPTALEVLNPAFVDIKKDGSIWYGSGTSKKELKWEDITHIPFLAMPGANRGLNSIEYAGVAFALALAAMEYGERWFAQGASPSYLLSTDMKLGQEEVKRIAEKFMIEHSGLQAAHLPLVVDQGLRVEKIQSTPDEAQYLNTLEYARRVIAAWFGLPTHLVGGTADGGNVWGGTVEQQSIQMTAFTLSGYITRLDQAYSSLLPDGEKAALDDSSLKNPDAASTAKLIQMSRLTGVETANEIRVARLHLPPHPDGDELIQPLNSNTSPTVGAVFAEEVADELDIAVPTVDSSAPAA